MIDFGLFFISSVALVRFHLFIFGKSKMIGFIVFQVHSQLFQGVQPYIVLQASSGRCVSLFDFGGNMLVPWRPWSVFW